MWAVSPRTRRGQSDDNQVYEVVGELYSGARTTIKRFGGWVCDVAGVRFGQPRLKQDVRKQNKPAGQSRREVPIGRLG